MGAALLFAVGAAPPSDGAAKANFVLLSEEECWRRMPEVETGASSPLPNWTRILAGPMPYTAVSALRLDYVYRTLSPLDPKLRSQMRWLAAHANRCAYSEEYAAFDSRRAGLEADDLAARCRGDDSGRSPAEKAALVFAREMALDSAAVTDEEFAALIRYYGVAKVVAMVQESAYANFQDRLLLCLRPEMEPGGPISPIDVRFAPSKMKADPTTHLAIPAPRQASPATRA